MKTIFLVVALCAFVACKNGKDDNKPANDDTALRREGIFLNGGERVPNETAMGWIKGIKRMRLNDDSIAWTEYNVDDLRKLFNDTAMRITRVRFFLGAYDTTGPGNSRRLVPRIVMQLRRDTGTAGMAEKYDYLYFTGKTVCPPPYDEPCSIE